MIIESNKITPAKEDYLKIMLELSESSSGILSVDIANALNVTKASVSCMMNVLKQEGYIEKEKYGNVTLTEKGRTVAAFVKKRHDLLKSFLTDVLGVDGKVADDDACKMEHVVSAQTVKKLNQRMKKISDDEKDVL